LVVARQKVQNTSDRGVGSGRAGMSHDLENVRRLGKKLRENLVKCASDPDVDAVHDTRTGTRRLQATLEDLVRESSGRDAGEPVRTTATATMRLLKKIRHEAGPVRDLDVHRKLVEKLAKRVLDPEAHSEDDEEPRGETDADVLEGLEGGFRPTAVEQQADDLDAWLKHRRSELAEGLRADANELAEKLDKRLEELEHALKTARARRTRKKPPGVVALDSFARLASEMQVLDAGNLHDFRKGAKKARYVAELAAQGDEQAKQVGETLKKLQDEIGDWHDWLVLAEEAYTALGDQAPELTALLEAERERHFVAAMKMAEKLRGRLMGEWLAVSGSPATRTGNPARRRAVGPQHRATS
jgi:CHAD domain-containing protein